METNSITYGRRLALLAAERPHEPGLIFAAAEGSERRLGFAELESMSNRSARLLQARGASSGSVVVLLLPNSPWFVLACLGAWKLGACVLPLPVSSSADEVEALLAAASESGRPLVRVAEPFAADAERFAPDPLPDVVANPGRAIATGGSSGRPKIIVEMRPWLARPLAPGVTDPFGRRAGDRVLIGGPLYHAAPFGAFFAALMDGSPVVLMDRFDAVRWVELVNRFGAEWAFLVPTQMLRIGRLPSLDRAAIPSLRTIYHAGSACPEAVKRRWIELLGPEGVHELYGSAERIGATFIRGDEWLRHPGSVGNGGGTVEIRILDETGREAPAGTVGEIFMRWKPDASAGYLAPGSGAHEMCEYWGGGELTTVDGFATVHDLGWLDEDGYLYIADRRSDMIVTGGANVYPAEVEAALLRHPDVRDVVVVGLPDPEWGRRVHAIVEADAGPDLVERLDGMVGESLAPPKRPKTYEIVAALPRSESGKIRRTWLAQERARQEAGHGV